MICNICINDKTTKKLDSLDLCDECRVLVEIILND
jgi:hypothetical protein